MNMKHTLAVRSIYLAVLMFLPCACGQEIKTMNVFDLTRQEVIDKTLNPYDGISTAGVDTSTLDGTTAFKYSDGKRASVFSSLNRKTVVRHFKWMKDYGIDGVFLQRFACEVYGAIKFYHLNVVLANCRAGANINGRTYAVMYDLSWDRPGQIERTIRDWKILVDNFKITKDANDKKLHEIIAKADEATAIFKCTDNPPVGKSKFLTMEGLPSDHYLWLTGQGRKMLNGEIEITEEMPSRRQP